MQKTISQYAAFADGYCPPPWAKFGWGRIDYGQNCCRPLLSKWKLAIVLKGRFNLSTSMLKWGE